MKRIRWTRWFAVACIGLACLLQASCCWFCKKTVQCQKLAKDQHEAVGAFFSLGYSPPNVVEVGPTRIRAYNGEKIIWTIRNPSSMDVDIELSSVARDHSFPVPLSTVFASTGGRVRIPKDCGINFLEAQLAKGLVATDSCASQTFNYTFMLYKTPTSAFKDSSICTWPYDPELVVEGKP